MPPRSRYLVYLSGLALIAFGVPSLFWPQWTAGLTGFELSSAAAHTEVRAFYGGLELGLGLLLLAWGSKPPLVYCGLWLSLAAFGGIAAGRVLGIALDGEASTFTLTALGLEAVLALASLTALLMDGGRRESLRGLMTALRAPD